MQKKSSPAENPQESRELLRSIVRFMKLNHDLSLKELVSIYSEVSPEETIPVSIFSKDLSPSEALCKYLKDNRELNFHEIALLLNRDDRSIWTSYARARKKSGEPLVPVHEDLMIPVTIFADRSLSILEHVVHYMKEDYGLSNSRIAHALGKNPSSIATVAGRALKKKGVSV